MQVDVNLVEQELQAAAAVEADLRAALAALQREFDTASVLTISLQEQLKDRDQRVRPDFFPPVRRHMLCTAVRGPRMHCAMLEEGWSARWAMTDRQCRSTR